MQTEPKDSRERAILAERLAESKLLVGVKSPADALVMLNAARALGLSAADAPSMIRMVDGDAVVRRDVASHAASRRDIERDALRRWS